MDPLDRHRERVRRMQASLERLLDLHRQIHDLQAEIVALSASGMTDREARTKPLHDKVRGLLPEVERAQQALARADSGADDEG